MKSTVLITGASSGIGRACAETLAVHGYNLVLIARRSERLQEAARVCKQKNPVIQVDYFSLDVNDRKQVDGFFQNNGPLVEKIDILINNSGLAKGVEPVHKANFADWEIMFDTNVKSLLYFTHKLLPSMVKRNHGHIVNLGSVAGRWVYPGGAIYCATKFAVRAFSEGLRHDLLGTKIRVTNVEPGMVQTEFAKVRLGSEEKANKVYEGMTPLNAHDIAEAVLWSLQRPPHVNIQELVIFPTDQAGVSHVHRSSTPNY